MWHIIANIPKSVNIVLKIFNYFFDLLFLTNEDLKLNVGKKANNREDLYNNRYYTKSKIDSHLHGNNKYYPLNNVMLE